MKKPQLKSESIKFNYGPSNKLDKQSPQKSEENPPLKSETLPSMVTDENKNESEKVMSNNEEDQEEHLPLTTKPENKLGFFTETSNSEENTYKSEIPIVDWNNDSKILVENNNNAAPLSKRNHQNRPHLRHIELDKSLIRKNKAFLDNSIKRIKQHTFAKNSKNRKIQLQKVPYLSNLPTKKSSLRNKIQNKAYNKLQKSKSQYQKPISLRNKNIINRFDDFFKNMKINQSLNFDRIVSKGTQSHKSKRRSKSSLYKGQKVTLDSFENIDQNKKTVKKDHPTSDYLISSNMSRSKKSSVNSKSNRSQSANNRSFRIKRNNSQNFSKLNNSVDPSQEGSHISRKKQKKKITPFENTHENGNVVADEETSQPVIDISNNQINLEDDEEF